MKELLVLVFALRLNADPPQVIDAADLVFRKVLGAQSTFTAGPSGPALLVEI